MFTVIVSSYVKDAGFSSAAHTDLKNEPIDTISLFTGLLLADTGQIKITTGDITNIIVHTKDKKDFDLVKSNKGKESLAVVAGAAFIVVMAIGFTQLFEMRF